MRTFSIKLIIITFLGITLLGNTVPVQARSTSDSTGRSNASLVEENNELKAQIAELIKQIAILKGSDTPTSSGKDTLVVYPRKSSAITFKNVDSKTANNLCVALGGNDFYETSTCTYAGKTISDPTPTNSADGKNRIRFVTPRPGDNDTISLNSYRYRFTVSDKTTKKISAPDGKYRIFGFYYSPDRSDRPERVHEFKILTSRVVDKEIRLESDLTVDNSLRKPTAGDYYFYVVNTQNGASAAVGSVTYLLPPPPPKPTSTIPVAAQPKTIYCAANFAIKPIWGTTVYTDDSDVCTAAAHTGVILHSLGGTVSYTSTASQGSYTANKRNNIQSNAWSIGAKSGFRINGTPTLHIMPRLSVSSPIANQTITIGNPIPVRWSYTSIPLNSQIITKLEIIQNGTASPVSTWHSPQISGNGTYTYPGGWKTGDGNLDTPGTYRITSSVRKCGDGGCDFYALENDSIPPLALATMVQFILKK